MESLGFMDDLLDFSSDICDEDEEDKSRKAVPSLTPNGSEPESLNVLDHSKTEFPEEELEWISNKDAFPMFESFADIISDQPSCVSKNQSIVSALEYSTGSSNSNNSTNRSTLMSCCGSIKVPVRARSKHRRKCRRGLADISGQQFWWGQLNNNTDKEGTVMTVTAIGRKCLHCGAGKTPQWRAGPLGPKTLCNACGVRYKSGRLVPEYRPANSPTFCSELHSNSHRKIMDMRRQKEMGTALMGTGKGLS